MSSKRFLKLVAIGLGLTLSGAVLANPVNILWYTGGVVSGGSSISNYDTAVGDLAALAPTSPGSNTWNVTFWNGGTMPTGTFNVLVIASPTGPWSTDPDYSALQAAVPSFGDRLMLTGQDADWHYQNNPGPTAFDGPQGFLLDSINWASSGTGMGLVALGMTGVGGCDGGPELGLSGYASDCIQTDNVQIPATFASFPINTNLSSAGLSNWNTSAHTSFFDIDLTKWTGINVNGDNNCGGEVAPSVCYVTIVSAATSGGGITTAVPEPAELGMFGLGLMLIGVFVGLRRRRTA